MGQFIKSIGSSLKRVDFIDCSLHPNSMVGSILGSCSTVARVSFSRETKIPRSSSNFVSRSPEGQITPLPMKPYYFLTYLKLAFEYPSDICRFQVDSNQLSSIIRQCHSLQHLFMDSGGSVHHGQCIMEALKHCPQITNIVVSDKATMPQTVTSAIDENEYDTSLAGSGYLPVRSQKVKGLRRLVLTGWKIKLTYKNLALIFKRAHKSLELLYLHFNGETINPTALDKLASYGAPRLRELRLSTEDYASSVNRHQSITKVLALLFASTPALEAIDINDTFNTLASFSSYDTHNPRGILEVDDTVLKSIAKNCLQIRHIRIAGERKFTKDGMVLLATKGGSRLTYLEADMDRSAIVPVVQKLTSLKVLYLRKDTYRIGDAMSELSEGLEESLVRRILRERGGQLIVL